MWNRKRATVLVALSLVGCGAPAVTSSSAPTPAAFQGGEVVVLHPTDEQVAYGKMAAVAMRQSRLLTLTKSVALYQWDDPKHQLYPIVKAVLEENQYREVHHGEMQVACSVPDRPGLRGGSRSGR